MNTSFTVANKKETPIIIGQPALSIMERKSSSVRICLGVIAPKSKNDDSTFDGHERRSSSASSCSFLSSGHKGISEQILSVCSENDEKNG